MKNSPYREWSESLRDGLPLKADRSIRVTASSGGSAGSIIRSAFPKEIAPAHSPGAELSAASFRLESRETYRLMKASERRSLGIGYPRGGEKTMRGRKETEKPDRGATAKIEERLRVYIRKRKRESR